YIRAFDRRGVIRLKPGPAARVIREVMESAVALARSAMEGAGVSQEAINRAEALFRARDRERLALQIESGDVRTGHDRILTEAQPRFQ
ncbi:hypothetical protein ACI4BE_28795, partial [Klebsiella pneumoniae]|uniref:hypothetical protein n=1 Tax=Klebsiella pneumoniae TaxID=573 RepID=UPI00385252D2